MTYHIRLPLLILFYSSYSKYVYLNFKKIVNKPITDKSRNLLPIVKYVSTLCYHNSKKNLILDINCQSFKYINVFLFYLISLYSFFLIFTYFLFCFSIVFSFLVLNNISFCQRFIVLLNIFATFFYSLFLLIF